MKYFYLLKNLKKIRFNLQYKKIVVFDGYSLVHLKFVLEGQKYFILEDRKENIDTLYITPSVIFNFVKYFSLIFKKYSLKVIYSIAVIKAIKPKIVITAIDNSINFFLISKALKNSVFCLAIQNNGRASHADIETHYIKKNVLLQKNYKDLYYIPNYVCFGQVVADSCTRQNLTIENVYQYGAIQIGNFYQHVKKNNIRLNKNLYDICFISEPGIDTRVDKFAKIIKLLKFSIKISIQNNLKFIFVSKFSENLENFPNLKTKDYYISEINFYKKNLNKQEFEYLILNMNIKKHIYSSHMALFQSSLGIGVQSSLLYYKMSCKEKILACNFTNETVFDFPIKGICSMKNPNYKDFKSRVKMIFSLNTDEYLKRMNKDPQYYINFDSKENVIDKIKQLIKNNLD